MNSPQVLLLGKSIGKRTRRGKATEPQATLPLEWGYKTLLQRKNLSRWSFVASGEMPCLNGYKECYLSIG